LFIEAVAKGSAEDDTTKLPLIVERVFTVNPKSGVIDAV